VLALQQYPSQRRSKACVGLVRANHRAARIDRQTIADERYGFRGYLGLIIRRRSD